MSELICSECGRGRGWHLWTCPVVEASFRFEARRRPRMLLTADEDLEGVRVIDTVILERLPEVE